MSFISRIFSLPFWLHVFQTVLHSCQRFPFTVLSLLVLNFVCITEIHNLDLLTENQQRNIFLISFGGTFWFIATTLLAENLQWNKVKHYLFALPIFILYGWLIVEQNIVVIESTLLILTAASFITFAPYLTRPSDNASVWYFNYQFIAACFFAILAAVLLASGVGLSLMSLEYLFEFDVNHRIYEDIWLIAMVFLAPLYLLTSIPKQFDYPRSDCQFPKGVHFILTYILVPLSLIYMIILYAYFIKISIQGELPQGHLGLMISWFGVIGIITHLAIYPIHDRSSALLNWFYRHFYIMLIVPLGLLTLAISARILQYGFTEKRYIIALCATWFALLIVTFLFNRQRFQLKHVTVSLAIITGLSSFGPWGIQQLPISSQFSRLESILNEQHLLQNGLINVTNQPEAETQKSISSIVDYLVAHDAEYLMRPWFENQKEYDDLVNCKHANDCYFDGQDIVKLMGINYINHWSDTHSELTEIKRSNINNYNKVLEISGYDILIPIPQYKFRWNNEQIDPNSDYQLRMDDNAQLTVDIAGKDSLKFDLAHYSAQLTKSGGNSINIAAEQADKLILKATTAEVSATLYIDNLQIWTSNNEISSTSLEGYLLIKTNRD